MSLISEDYRSLNEKLHSSNPAYGTSGKKWANTIHQLALSLQTTDILDYGCGKSTLANNLPFKINQYDPAVSRYSTRPIPADIVVCTDVLEHIEPENLDTVLDDIKSLTRIMGFFTVATRPAKKVLEDGRNAHLIQESVDWWIPKFISRFHIKNINVEEDEFVVVVQSRKKKLEIV